MKIKGITILIPQTIAALSILVLLAPLSLAQIIENPETPSGPNAGRILKLTEVMRIKDGKGFFSATLLG